MNEIERAAWQAQQDAAVHARVTSDLAAGGTVQHVMPRLNEHPAVETKPGSGTFRLQGYLATTGGEVPRLLLVGIGEPQVDVLARGETLVSTDLHLFVRLDGLPFALRETLAAYLRGLDKSSP